MKVRRNLYLALVWLLTAVLVLSSCAQNAPVATPKTKPETTKTAMPIAPTAPTSPLSPTPTSDSTSSNATEPVTSSPTKSTVPPITTSSPPIPTPTYTPPPPPTLAPIDAFKKGITFAAWKGITSFPGLYTRPGADQSLKNLAATGANWIDLVVVISQENISSTTMSRKPPVTATDAELKGMVDLAHSLGLRVMLMPMIVLYNDPSHFAGYIGTAFNNEAQWQDWFASYRETINYYAAFAQNSGVDMFVIGHELGATTSRETDWRRIVQEVRQQFQGPITYSSLASTASFPHGEEKRITWWDAVDYIGIQAYYKLTTKNDPTVEELKAAWTTNGHIALLEGLSSKFNKPIIFTEIGYVSMDGTNKVPANNNYVPPIDLQEQADCYQAALEALWGKPWLAGMFWWQWRAEPGLGGPNDISFNPYGKPAEDVLKRFYLSQ